MHGSCACEARKLVCDVPPMKGSVNLSGPLPGTGYSTVDGAGECVPYAAAFAVSCPRWSLFASHAFLKGPECGCVSQSVSQLFRAGHTRAARPSLTQSYDTVYAVSLSDVLRVARPAVPGLCHSVKRGRAGRFRSHGAPPEPLPEPRPGAQHQASTKPLRTSRVHVLRSECTRSRPARLN